MDFIKILTLITLGVKGSYEISIKEINNPIIPVQLGTSEIITTKHTFLYHINLSDPYNSIIQIKTSLVNLEKNVRKQESLNHLSLFLIGKIKNVFSLTEIILDKINTFFIHRKKRGLINAIGKAQNWLFGTLDSDDKEQIDKYFELIHSNENKLHDDLKTQQSLLKQIVNIYGKTFKNLSDNQVILETQIKYLSKEIASIVNVEQAFSFSNIIDNLLLQLQTIQHIINNLEIAISFAKLNILHSTIIQPNQLKLAIKKLTEIYTIERIPKFQNLINYYSLFSTQVFFQNNIIVFKIHTPIISSKYKYFQLYSIPINNQTIIPDQPYLLLNAYDYWSTMERCPTIERRYFCLQENLHKYQPCLAELIRDGINSCKGTSIHFSETTIMQISPKELLVIPAKRTNIKSSCNIEGIYEIKNPSIVILDNCIFTIDGKTFQAEKTTQEKFIFELPKIEIPPMENENKKIIKLKQVDSENIRRINSLAENLHINELQFQTNSSHPWANTWLIIIAVLALGSFLIYKKKLKTRKIENSQEKKTKIREPLFSSLGREEL